MRLLIHALALCFLTLNQASDLDQPASDPPALNLPEQPTADPKPADEPATPTAELEKPAEEPEPTDQQNPSDPPEQPPTGEPEQPAQEPERPASEPQEPEVPRPDILTEDEQKSYERVLEWVRKYLRPDESRFTVYTREDYDKATSLRVVSDEFPFYLGEVNAKDQCAADSKGCTHREFNNQKESKLLNIRKITVSPVRTWGHDQYIYLHFSDGARIWYKQPRYGRFRINRPDAWIKGKSYLGLFGRNGHYVPDEKSYNDYPDQVLITRPRNQNDPEKSNAWEYLRRARRFGDIVLTVAMVAMLMTL